MKSLSWKHLIWILYLCFFVFALPFIFVNLLKAPTDLYYIAFLAGSTAFVIAYRKYSSFKIRNSLNSGWALGSILAVFIGLVFLSFSLTRTHGMAEFIMLMNSPVVIWRGIIFGLASGIMISTFPFVIVWRSLAGANPGNMRKLAVVAIAAASIALASFCHNLGLTGFDMININEKIPGNIVAGLPTLLSGNTLAAPIAGAFLSVSQIMKTEHGQQPQDKIEIAIDPVQDGGAN